MIRSAATVALVAGVLLAADAVATYAHADQHMRRRAAPEITVTRPSWLTTPKATFRGEANSMRPDIRYANTLNYGLPAGVSTSMRGSVVATDPFWGAPANVVQWPWPGAFYRN